MKPLKSHVTRLALGLVTFGGVGAIGALGAVGADPASASTPGVATSVFTSTNATSGNTVEAFLRQPDGSLIANGTYSTGGLGSGIGGSQGSVTLTKSGRTLYVVDSGSNQISQFAVSATGSLTLTDLIGSGGADPTSVAVKGDLVEVLNAGSLNVAEFYATKSGLVEVAGSSQPLANGASAPVDVTITPSGTQVVVTDKVANTISTFAVESHDVLGPVITTASDGPAAFASAYVHNQLLVADAGGSDTSAVSPYAVALNGGVVPTQAPVGNDQSAACWIATNPFGYVFVANAGSASISTYKVRANGTLIFLTNTTLAAGAKPLDLVASSDGHNVYAIDETNSLVDSFSVGANGTLTPVGATQSVPLGALGIAEG